MIMNIYEYLNDFDNAELSEDEWREQMEEAIWTYNEEHGTEYRVDATIRNYRSWKRDKAYNDF